MIDIRTTALAPLTHYPQWVAWRIEDRSGKPTKVPYSPRTGQGASSVNPADWVTYDEAVSFATSRAMAGVGFVLTANDPFYCLDLDACLVDGAWSPTAIEMWSHLGDRVAAELSQSGRGLHMWGMYDPAAPRAHRQRADGRELYTDKRFIAVTGNMVGTGQMADYDALFAWLVSTHFAPEAPSLAALSGWTDRPVDEWFGPEDDEDLLAKAMRSQSVGSAFKGEPCFADLWTRNVDVLAKRWPPESPGQDFDASRADGSLAASLAFWTGKDCERIERLMRRSALARDKWGDHGSYLRGTILGACGKTSKVLGQDAKRDSPAPHPIDMPTPQQVEEAGFGDREGLALLSHAQQVDHFARCIYVVNINRILTPRGELLDQARFNATYGGYEFIWYADGRKTTTSAWTAFTEAQSFIPPRADRLCFRPEHGSGGIIVSAGKRMANAYIEPDPIDAKPGDPSKFLDHMAKMLPEGDDLKILLSYMACAVQNPGRKIQWWPVVQGAEGNFKSTLLRIMSCAVGWHYAHTPNMKKMVNGDSNFNGWIDRKLFLGLDEVYAANRREFFEGFKTTITNLEIPIEGKGIEETTGDNRANGLIVTNHQDGVPITEKNRRYGAFFCAQQTPEDMIRDGMTPAYVHDMHSWLMGLGDYAHLGPEHGIRVMAYHLLTREIEARFNPLVTLIRAPRTSSTDKALAAGLGSVEQAILEAIEETNAPGFRGGWVSGHWLKQFLDTRRDKIPRNGRRALMQNIGYDWHPALEKTKGQVTQDIAFDGGARSRIYCKVGSIMWNELKDSASIVKAYEAAQQKPMSDDTRAAFGAS